MNSNEDLLMDAAKGAFKAPFAGVIRVESTDGDASLWVDGRGDLCDVSQQAPPEVSSHFCLWRADFMTLASVLKGQRRLETAFIAGQLKICGDMAVMARIELEGAP